MASQWKRDNSTTFTIRISNDTGLPDRIREEAEKNAISVSQVFIQAITDKFGGLTSGLTNPEKGLTTNQDNGLTKHGDGLTTNQENGLTTGLTNNVPQPAAPAVPTYIPTDASIGSWLGLITLACCLLNSLNRGRSKTG